MSWFLGDYNQSIIYANKAIANDPVNIEALIQRAVVFESKKDYPEVIKDLSRVTQLLKPDDPRKYDVKFSLIRAQKNLASP
jgi:tetratricopeptide (TPR) repeat protein